MARWGQPIGLPPSHNRAHAWNVDALLSAAIAWPEKERQRSHIYLPPETAILLGENKGWPGGTVFDHGSVSARERVLSAMWSRLI